MSLKKLGKNLICAVLERQVKRLRLKHNFQIIAVAGSVGKTSTKLAIAKTLAASSRVIYQDGNYNDRLTVPLVLFNQAQPNIFNLLAWIRIILKNQKLINNYPYQLAVLELGTDAPGQLAKFAYLKPELIVLTSIAHEHMEFFSDLAAVAKEELTPLNFSKTALISLDHVSDEYLPKQPYLSYGQSLKADYRLVNRVQTDLAGQQIDLKLKDQDLSIKAHFLGSQGATTLLAAAAVADILNLPIDKTKHALENLKPAPGRMQLLKGIKDSTLIDDTYNASPVAVKAALDVLYSLKAKQRIAILGSMNELGQLTELEHQAIGRYCDPNKLDLVVTVGELAKNYLAPAAQQAGCQAISFLNPIEAGQYVKDQLKPGAVVLAKGSQNRVFAEEAIKQLLLNQDDQAKLVRQSGYWLKLKHRQFG